MKLKKNVKIILIIAIIVLILGIGAFTFFKIKEKKDYEKTYDYKLSTLGYEKDDINTLKRTYGDEELEFILKQEKNDVYVNLGKEKYFIYSNFYKYLDYLKNNNDESNLEKIVEIVNANVDNEFYENTQKTDISKKELMLVNKYNYLEKDYLPEELTIVPLQYSYGDLGSQKVTKKTYDAFLNMWNASHEAGFYLMINSSYRDFDEQQVTYDDYAKNFGTNYADSIAARPGFSEHQTGYSIDVFEQGYGQKDFASTDSYKWLKENAHKYGFIERYPEDKVAITGYAYESWHYRYVGVEAATYIYENDITFDEYYAYFVK